jgi:hypothetical protein
MLQYRVLYYPDFSPDSVWLRRVLMLTDSVMRIVPSDVKPDDFRRRSGEALALALSLRPLVTFWGKNSAIFDGKIGVNTRKRLALSGAGESPLSASLIANGWTPGSLYEQCNEQGIRSRRKP